MKYLIAAVLAVFLAGCQMTTTQIVDKNINGIVLVQNKIDASTGGAGTGFILEDNQIITNNHVVEGDGQITIYSGESQHEYEAEVVYKDPIADIAVVRLRDWELFEKNENPKNLSLGDSDVMKQGDKIIVIGHPWGLTWTVSEGILSAKHRRAGQNPKFMDQVDANLFQGNSGGPIFNDKGEVICISTMMLAMEGGSYGFCVPSNLVKKVVHDFNVFGEVRWRALNISVEMSANGDSVLIGNLEPNGAAEKAGLMKGDKLIAIYAPSDNTKGIEINDPNDLITELAMLNGDVETVKLSIERNGEELMIDVKTNHKLSSDYTPDKGK